MSFPQRLRLGVNTALLRQQNMPKLVWEAGPSFEQSRQEPASPPSSPTRATIDLEDGTAARSSKSTGDQASSGSELSREGVDDCDMDTDCVSCSDTDEVSIKTAYKKHQRRVQASCRLSKGSLCMEAQLKRISDSCQDMWGHNHQALEQSRKALLWKTTTPMRCRKWSGLANCSASLRPLAPKFPLEIWRPKPMTG